MGLVPVLRAEARDELKRELVCETVPHNGFRCGFGGGAWALRAAGRLNGGPASCFWLRRDRKRSRKGASDQRSRNKGTRKGATREPESSLSANERGAAAMAAAHRTRVERLAEASRSEAKGGQTLHKDLEPKHTNGTRNTCSTRSPRPCAHARHRGTSPMLRNLRRPR